MTDLGLLLAPLGAGLLALVSHVPLGRQVLRRGIVFIDLAIAQMAGLGVMVAALMLHEPPAWVLAGAAALSALLGPPACRRWAGCGRNGRRR